MIKSKTTYLKHTYAGRKQGIVTITVIRQSTVANTYKCKKVLFFLESYIEKLLYSEYLGTRSDGMLGQDGRCRSSSINISLVRDVNSVIPRALNNKLLHMTCLGLSWCLPQLRTNQNQGRRV